MNSSSASPLRIGHRGVRSMGLENSLAALAAAVENPALGLAAVEIDVHSTADGEIVLHHDPITVHGTLIARTDWARLRGETLSDGSPIPTLTDALEVLAPLLVYVEAKGIAESADGTLLERLRSGPTPHCYEIHSFDHRVIARLSAKAADFGFGVLSCSYPVAPEQQVIAAGGKTLWQEWQLIDRDLVNRCRERGIDVIAWTAPESEFERLAAFGVAGVCVDL